MQSGSGKFYDAAKTRSYCDQIQDEYDTYRQAAGNQTTAYADFSANDCWRGSAAVMGKKLIGESETGTLSEIVQIQKDMSDLHADIIDRFAYDVDAAPNAKIRGDDLVRTDRDFKELFHSYDTSARDVEQMADELGARFEKYGSFTKPDFESGRDAFRDLCGGEYEHAGYLYECREKLEKYDAQTTEMIRGSGIRERMEELDRQISTSDGTIRGSGTTPCTEIIKQTVKDIHVTVTGAENGAMEMAEGAASALGDAAVSAGNAAEGLCRELLGDGKALLSKIKGTDFAKKAGKIVSTYGGAYDNSNGSMDDTDRKIRASLKIGTHLLSLAAEELGSSIKGAGDKLIDKKPQGISGAFTMVPGIQQLQMLALGAGAVQCRKDGENPGTVWEHADKYQRAFTKGVFNGAADFVTGIIEIPQLAVDAGYGLSDTGKAASEWLAGYKGNPADLMGELADRAVELRKAAFRMAEDLGTVTKEKLSGMKTEDWFEAGGYATSVIASFFLGGAGAVGEAADTANVAGKTAETTNAAVRTEEAINTAGKTEKVLNGVNKAGEFEKAAETANVAEKAEEVANVTGKTEEVVKAGVKTEKALVGMDKVGEAEATGKAISGVGDGNVIESGSNSKFKYEHNPSDNPKVLQDAMEDTNAVYAYSPNPESESIGGYANNLEKGYDWSDPKKVEVYQKRRLDYHNNNDNIDELIIRMEKKGASPEEIGRTANYQRNKNRIDDYINNNDLIGLENVKRRNLAKYGDEFGLTAEGALKKYGSWEKVIEKSKSANPGMDASCGLYDKYYHLYRID